MPSVARLAALLLFAFAFAAPLFGCGDAADTASSAGSSAASAASDSSSEDAAAIEVPDVSGEDGADAVSTMETEGLTATTDDPTQDGTGCTVEDQDPAAGSEAAEGDEVSLTVDCTQRDWDEQDGEVWEQFSSGFTSGFSDGCDALFSMSPDGSLYNEDDEYTVLDCTNLEPDPSDADLPGDVPEDPESEGQAIGFDGGCEALFDDAMVYELYWGENSVGATACQAQGTAATSSSSGGSKSASPAPKTSGDSCAAAAATDGRQVRISVDKGEVNCKGALALWNAYLAAAPEQAQGSAGLVELDGWSCLTAKTGRAKDLGGCSTDDGSAFSVTAG